MGREPTTIRPAHRAEVDPETNDERLHILARGDTHLPFAKPRFGTPCAALLPAEERRRKESEYAAAMMGDMDSDDMGARPADPEAEHDDGED